MGPLLCQMKTGEAQSDTGAGVTLASTRSRNIGEAQQALACQWRRDEDHLDRTLEARLHTCSLSTDSALVRRNLVDCLRVCVRLSLW